MIIITSTNNMQVVEQNWETPLSQKAWATNNQLFSSRLDVSRGEKTWYEMHILIINEDPYPPRAQLCSKSGTNRKVHIGSL